jgi:uncharacterized membrane protein
VKGERAMDKSKLQIYPVQEQFRGIFHHLNYHRTYSPLTFVLFFFSFAIVGWVWEVGLHFYQTGHFVNRGVLNGPWLPIYGVGGVIIILLFHKLSSHPVIIFFSSMVLCSVIEYITSWYLEFSEGIRWWDYSGYVLNLNGRICLEGAIVFGLGGLAGIYVLGPLLDNVFRKICLHIKVLACSILVIFFAIDLVYTNEHPNTGEGITETTIEANAETDVLL